LNDHPTLEALRQVGLNPEQRARLFGMIAATFKTAIDARSPKKRPSGKAGLRAEKGYYRLLYLEANLHENVNTHQPADPDALAYDWNALVDILRQLADIPELRPEILAGIQTALDEIANPTQTVG
jgi:hypothetical protein